MNGILVISILILATLLAAAFIGAGILIHLIIRQMQRVEFLMQKMGIKSYDEAYNYGETKYANPLTEIHNNFMEEFAGDFDDDVDEEELDKAEALNTSAKIGDRATFNCNVHYNGINLTLDIPVLLAEKSIDNKKIRFELDMLNMPEGAPFSQPQFLEYLGVALSGWVEVDTLGITWRTGEGKYLQLTDNEKNDIKSFLKYTVLPADKQEKVQKILNL